MSLDTDRLFCESTFRYISMYADRHTDSLSLSAACGRLLLERPHHELHDDDADPSSSSSSS